MGQSRSAIQVVMETGTLQTWEVVPSSPVVRLSRRVATVTRRRSNSRFAPGETGNVTGNFGQSVHVRRVPLP